MNFTTIHALDPAVSSIILNALISPYSLFARAVVSGAAEGTVLLDKPSAPRDVLILTNDRLWWQPLYTE